MVTLQSIFKPVYNPLYCPKTAKELRMALKKPGVDVNARNSENDAPIHSITKPSVHASQSGREKYCTHCSQRVLHRPNALNDEGNTPLDLLDHYEQKITAEEEENVGQSLKDIRQDGLRIRDEIFAKATFQVGYNTLKLERIYRDANGDIMAMDSVKYPTA
eukprot:Em0024g281a